MDIVVQILIWLGGVAVLIIGGLLSVLIMVVRRNADGTSRTVERSADKQSTNAELLAGHSARIGQLEVDRGKIAEALDRLARLEEWRVHSMPRLDEVENSVETTARTMVAFDERMKTVFKRLDAMTEHMRELPREVAIELRTMIKPIDKRTPAHG